MELLKLSDLSPEECTKITQQIVGDLVRGFNVGNYSLLWRSLSEKLSHELDQPTFNDMQRDILSKHGSLESFELTHSNVANDQVSQEWSIDTGNNQTLKLSINFIPVKEFLAITDFAFSS